MGGLAFADPQNSASARSILFSQVGTYPLPHAIVAVLVWLSSPIDKTSLAEVVEGGVFD